MTQKNLEKKLLLLTPNIPTSLADLILKSSRAHISWLGSCFKKIILRRYRLKEIILMKK